MSILQIKLLWCSWYKITFSELFIHKWEHNVITKIVPTNKLLYINNNNINCENDFMVHG